MNYEKKMAAIKKALAVRMKKGKQGAYNTNIRIINICRTGTYICHFSWYASRLLQVTRVRTKQS